MIKAVIFDMDGVIIDSEPMHTKVVIEIMKEYGIQMTREDMDRFVGTTNATLWKTLTGEYHPGPSAEELKKIQRKRIIEAVIDSDDMQISGVTQLLSALRNSGKKTAIASSSGLDFIMAVVERYNLHEYFDKIVSGEEVKQGKPSPDIFIETASRLGIMTRECVVIEDSTHGVRAGIDAGMQVIGFINPNSGNQDLSGAYRKVSSFEQISVEMIDQTGSE